MEDIKRSLDIIRKRAGSLKDDLLKFLLDMTILHLSRKFASAADKPTTLAMLHRNSNVITLRPRLPQLGDQGNDCLPNDIFSPADVPRHRIRRERTLIDVKSISRRMRVSAVIALLRDRHGEATACKMARLEQLKARRARSRKRFDFGLQWRLKCSMEALSHEPVLLLITRLSAGTWFNNSNTLADRSRQ